MLRKLLVALLLASLLITHATATEYLADIKVQQIQGSDTTKSWTSASETTLNPEESWDYGSITIKYKSIESSNDKIWFYVTGTSMSTSDWLFKESETWCIRGSDCGDNMTTVSSNAIRMTLRDIRPSSTWFNSTKNENPVYAYVYINKEIALIKDDVIMVDVQKTRQETGVSYSKTTSEVYVYLVRKQSVPISISVKAESRTPKNEEWTSDRVKYTIDSSGTYTFTVKYTKDNAWGAETDTIETYGLKLINLGDTVSTTPASNKYKSTVYLPDTLIVDMGTAGSFIQQGGVSVSPTSGTEYRLTFDSEGVYKLKYTTSGGTTVDDAVVAIVRASQPTAKPTEKPDNEETEELTGNQKQDGTGEDNKLYYGIVFVALVVIIIYGLSRRKKYNIKPQKPQ